jgi:hypothetical protein
MEIILLAALASLSYLLILLKFIGMKRLLRWSKWFDALFTIGIPALTSTTGTFSAVVLSILSGLFFTVLLAVIKVSHSIKLKKLLQAL